MHGYCFKCRHELIDVGKSACPECGRWFDPEDPRTFYRRRPGRLACLIMKPAGWPSVVCGLALAILILAAFSVPDGYFLLVIIVFMAIPVAILALICDAVVSLSVSARMGRPWLLEVRPDRANLVWRRDQLKWLLAPVIVVLALALVALDVPSRFTFWVSSDSLLDLVENRTSQATVVPSPAYVGLIPVSSVEYPVSIVEGPEVTTVWLDVGIFDSVGFAYVPEAEDD